MKTKNITKYNIFLVPFVLFSYIALYHHQSDFRLYKHCIVNNCWVLSIKIHIQLFRMNADHLIIWSKKKKRNKFSLLFLSFFSLFVDWFRRTWCLCLSFVFSSYFCSKNNKLFPLYSVNHEWSGIIASLVWLSLA